MFRQLSRMGEEVVVAAAKDEVWPAGWILVHVQPQVALTVLRDEAVLTEKTESKNTRISVMDRHDESTQIIKNAIKGRN